MPFCAFHNILFALIGLSTVTTAQIVSNSGDSAIIDGWSLQSSAKLDDDFSTFSHVGANVSSWVRVSARSTVFAGLIQNGIFNDSELFFSDNLDTIVNYSEYMVPWLYRKEFDITPGAEQHYFLVTNGITSRANIWVNGNMVVSNQTQVGSYAGKTYAISDYLIDGTNCLLVQAYPTNYLRDFAMGFVDWNPYPPDNGTGIWRDINIRQTGPVSISAPRVTTNFEYPWQRSVTVTFYADISNNVDREVDAEINAVIQAPDGNSYTISTIVPLKPREEQTVSISKVIQEPSIWWPAQWGSQPLYSINGSVYVKGTVSDIAEPRSFGIRHVSSYVNAYNDTAFLVNGQPFLVQGAGYSADIFYRFDIERARSQLQLVLNMGLNTIRLEGKQEHPELYQLADEMGIMIIAGWECCDKWEGWSYNDEADGVKWIEEDYGVANDSMLHEAASMQTHPSFLAFLVGSDFWPNDRATQIYVDALDRYQWPNPIVASAAKRGYPDLLGPSGMKMDGPYDWVPPIYWWGDELGAAFGFGSELGAGVGTPEIDSLRKFLSEDDLDDLWQNPDMGLYHMSTNVSSFFDRSIYNEALFNRYGTPKSLDDYLLKSQIMDYEATRAQFEGFAARKADQRPATGNIYWMLNGAWPNLHWQLFDYYLAVAGSYFGVKTGTRVEHVLYNYANQTVYLVNSLLNSTGTRNVSVDLVDLTGRVLSHQDLSSEAIPNSAQEIGQVSGIGNITDVALLKLSLSSAEGEVLSRNVYWLSAENDVLNWTNSSWYSTPVTQFIDMSALFAMQNVTIDAKMSNFEQAGNDSTATITLENTSDIPAFFVRMKLVDGTGSEVLPAFWTDNYVTVFPNEAVDFQVSWSSSHDLCNVTVSGANVELQSLRIT